MARSRIWLVVFFVVSAALWVATLLLTNGDPIDVYGDPETFNSMVPVLSYDFQQILFPVLGISLAGLSFAHAWATLGLKPALSMLVVALLVAFLFEDIGIRTGLIFGPYFHTTIEGVKLGTVPVFVFCGWVSFVYIGWVLSNLVLDGSPVQKDFSVSRILIGSLIGAMMMTTMDLGVDPFAAANGWWVWIEGGAYEGVPLHNYVGWVALGFLTLAVHGFDFRQHEIADIDSAPAWKRRLTIVPVLVFGCIWAAFTLLNMEGYVGLIVFFAVGIPFLIALKRWLDWNKAAEAGE